MAEAQDMQVGGCYWSTGHHKRKGKKPHLEQLISQF